MGARTRETADTVANQTRALPRKEHKNKIKKYLQGVVRVGLKLLFAGNREEAKEIKKREGVAKNLPTNPPTSTQTRNKKNKTKKKIVPR